MSTICLTVLAYWHYLFGGKDNKNKTPNPNPVDPHFAMSIQPCKVSYNRPKKLEEIPQEIK
jgi:hypothetical protein